MADFVGIGQERALAFEPARMGEIMVFQAGDGQRIMAVAIHRLRLKLNQIALPIRPRLGRLLAHRIVAAKQ